LTPSVLYQEISLINASKTNRLKYAKMVLNDMSLFPKLIGIVFMVDDKVSCRAAWVFEFVCAENIYGVIPYLDIFTDNLNRIHLDSATRPVAKVCRFIATTYDSKLDITFKNRLKPEHKERIIEACFDWMINDGKVAPKVYAMETLFCFGKDIDWIYPELVLILEQDFQKQSSAYKVRAKRTLQKIKKLGDLGL
jgi:hypothetical protein